MASEVREASAELSELVTDYFPHLAEAAVPSIPLSLGDSEVIELIGRSKQEAKWRRLAAGETSDYAADDSRADMALCSILAFYCDSPEQIDRIFRTTELMREKWDSARGSSTYGADTIAKAWSEQTDHYKAPQRNAPPTKGLSEGTSSSASSLSLPWFTPSEVMASVSEEPDHVIKGMLIRGAVTELDAKIKAGKTTMLAHMIRAVVRETPVFGLPTKSARFVVLTEEGVETIKEWLVEVGLEEADDWIRIISFRDPAVQKVIDPLSWADVVAHAARQAREFGASVLIIDTLSKWARIPGDQENSAGVAADSMTPLEVAAAGKPKLAVWVNRHDRKAGGEVGDSGRGSSAFGGSSDIIFQLKRANTEGHPNRRILTGVGRFRSIPAEMIIELIDGEYAVIGDAKEVERSDARATLLERLPGPEADPWIEKELLEQLAPLARSTWQRARDDLLGAGLIEKVAGQGKTNRANGFRLSAKSSAQPREESGHTD